MGLDLLKTALHYIIPQHGLTSFAGYCAEVKHSKIKNYLIQRFIRQYQVNMSEALVEDPTTYACFNDFFIRHLKPACRPLAPVGIISPVDGCVSEIGTIKEGQLIQAKGHDYSVSELLACNQARANDFIQGRFATLYLSPKDYHRVHMPLDAQLISMTYIPGTLFSVQPLTVQRVPKLFARNERLVVIFSTEIGPMAMVLVGATLVGMIGTSWHGDLKRSKNRVDFTYNQTSMSRGDEMGYFKLGSTVVLLFANGNKVCWDKNLKTGSILRFGEAIGTIND